MISRDHMFEPLLEALPSFQHCWDEFLSEWSDEPELPQYLALSSLAHHLIEQLARGRTDELRAAFAVVERWHVEGDVYVREAATVGLLEDLQNHNAHEETDPEQFRRFLGPESERWWNKLLLFWSEGRPLTDDDDRAAAELRELSPSLRSRASCATSHCPCEQLPEAFFLDEAPQHWLEALREEEAGDWMTLRRCPSCLRRFSVDKADRLQHQVVVAVNEVARWQEEGTSPDRRKGLLLRCRGGLESELCVWVGCRSPRVRGVVYCLDHLWDVGMRR